MPRRQGTVLPAVVVERGLSLASREHSGVARVLSQFVGRRAGILALQPRVDAFDLLPYGLRGAGDRVQFLVQTAVNVIRQSDRHPKIALPQNRHLLGGWD